MQAFYDFDVTMKGSVDDLKKMLEVIGHYDEGNAQYILDVEVNQLVVDLKNLSDAIISEVAPTGEAVITAIGPYGTYDRLNDVGIFREMAEAAPGATFVGEIDGGGTYDFQNLKCELKDGKLQIRTTYESNDESVEAWKEHFIKIIPLEDFKDLFNVSGEDFDEEVYEDFLDEMESECYDNFGDMEYEDFVFAIEDEEAEIKLSKKEYKEIMTSKLSSLGIKCPAEFEDEFEGGEVKKYVYDPIARAYI